MNSEQRKNLMLSKRAFESVSEKIEKQESETIREYIYGANEWGLGVETLVHVLIEENIPISSTQYAVISEAINAMKLGIEQEKLLVVD